MAVLKLLRNQALYATHEAALTAINAKAEELGDGEIWIATYGEAPNAKSILAIKRSTGLTVFDNETSSDSITAAINKLDATVKDGLDSVDDTQVAEGKHVGVKVVETDGKLVSISVAEDDIASEALLGKTSDTASEQTAFGYIAKEVADRKKAIEDLDSPDNAVAKKFVTSVSESNGLISVSRGEVKSTDETVTITAGADGGIDLAVNVDGTTIKKSSGKLTVGTVSAEKVSVAAGTGLNATNAQAAFKELKDEINTVAVGAKKYTIEKQNTGLETNVKEQYVLKEIVGETKTPVGEPINIYKDSAYKEIYLGTANDTIDKKTGTITKVEEGEKQSLNYAYMKADGSYDLVKVDVSAFISENEKGDGIDIIDHKVAIKLDTTGDDTGTDKFLTVGANGLKLNGVSTAIANAIKALDVPADTETDEAGFVTTTISETDGKVSNDNVSVVYGDYKPENQKNGIAKTVDTKKYVDGVVAGKNVSAEGDNYVKASASNNKVTVATQIGNLTFAQGTTSDSTLSGTANKLIDSSDAADKISRFVNARIREDIAKLDTVITSNDGINVNVKVTETDGKISGVSITKDNTASAAALSAEIAARKAVDGQTGDTYTKNTSANYIAQATSLNDADIKLDEALKAVDDAMLTGVTEGNAITVSEKTAKNQTISLKLDTTTKPTGFKNADNVLSITDNGLYLSSIIDCGTY